MEQNRVRIADIADALGLSTATVSNVIHGKTKKISASSDCPIHRCGQRAGGLMQPERQPDLRSVAVSTIFAGCRGLSRADSGALQRRWSYSASGRRVFSNRGVCLSSDGAQHGFVRVAALQGPRRYPLFGKPWRGSCQHRAELSADIRQAGVCMDSELHLRLLGMLVQSSYLMQTRKNTAGRGGC